MTGCMAMWHSVRGAFLRAFHTHTHTHTEICILIRTHRHLQCASVTDSQTVQGWRFYVLQSSRALVNSTALNHRIINIFSISTDFYQGISSYVMLEMRLVRFDFLCSGYSHPCTICKHICNPTHSTHAHTNTRLRSATHTHTHGLCGLSNSISEPPPPV